MNNQYLSFRMSIEHPKKTKLFKIGKIIDLIRSKVVTIYFPTFYDENTYHLSR